MTTTDLSPFQQAVAAYVAANPVTLPEGAGLVIRSELFSHSFWPADVDEDAIVSLTEVIATAGRNFRLGKGSGVVAHKHAFRNGLLDVLGSIVEGRRGSNAPAIREVIPLLRGDDGTQNTQLDTLTRRLDDNYKRIPQVLRHPGNLQGFYENFAGPWSGGVKPANTADFVEAVLLALRLRLGEAAPLGKVKIAAPEVILVLGRKEFKVNTETLVMEAIAYPLPKAGERWQDAQGTPYLIAQELVGAVNLKTGVLLPLEEGVIPGAVLGETFYKQ